MGKRSNILPKIACFWSDFTGSQGHPIVCMANVAMTLIWYCSFAENVGVNNKKLFEGDMRLTDEQVYNAEHGLDVDSTRKRGSIALDRLWRNAMVPYDISSSLSKFLVLTV